MQAWRPISICRANRTDGSNTEPRDGEEKKLTVVLEQKKLLLEGTARLLVRFDLI